MKRQEYTWRDLPEDITKFELFSRTMMNRDITAQLISREVERQTYEARLRKQKVNIQIKHLLKEFNTFDVYLDEDGNFLTEQEYKELEKQGKKVHYRKGLRKEDLYEKTTIYLDNQKKQISKKEWEALPEDKRRKKVVCSNYIISKFRRAELSEGYNEFKQRRLNEFENKMSGLLAKYSIVDSEGNVVHDVLDKDGKPVTIKDARDAGKWTIAFMDKESPYYGYKVKQQANPFTPSVIRGLYKREAQKIWLDWRKGYTEDGKFVEGRYNYNQQSG